MRASNALLRRAARRGAQRPSLKQEGRSFASRSPLLASSAVVSVGQVLQARGQGQDRPLEGQLCLEAPVNAEHVPTAGTRWQG